MVYKLLNELTEAGKMQELYRCGLMPMTAFCIRDACNMYMIYRSMGKRKSDAHFMVCLKLNRSEKTVYGYLRKGGVIGL